MRGDDHNPLERLMGDDPGIDASRRDRIEAGIRVQHAGQHHSTAPQGRRVPRWLVAAPALVVLLLIATALLVVRDEGVVAALEVRDARSVTVTLPDGSIVEDPADGFRLRDGAVVSVGEDGSITIDNVTLGSGAVVTVRDGQLVSDVVATTTIRDAGSVDRPGVNTTTSQPSRSTTTSTPPPGSQPSTSRPTTSIPSTSLPRTSLPSDVRPTPPPETSAPPSTTRPAADTPGQSDDGPRDGTIELALRVTTGDGQVRVVWRVEGELDDHWTVLVLRTTNGSTPVQPDAAARVGSGPRGEVVERRENLPDEIVALRYRVVVFDDGGGIVAAGAVQTVEPPES